MTNPFIPQDNYISRITDRLEKEGKAKEYKQLLESFYKGVEESMQAMCENVPTLLSNMLKIESEAIKKMFNLK